EGPDLSMQLEQLVAAGLYSPQEAREIDLATIAWFFATPTGQALRSTGTRIFREWPFVIGVDPARYDPAAAAVDSSELLLVRGIVDLIFNCGDGWELIDYKTDAVDGPALQSRAAEYHGQLAIYAHAVEAEFAQPVLRKSLVFLHPRRIIEFAE